MSNEVTVAIVGAVGVVIVAVFTYLGIITRRAATNGNGNGKRYITAADLKATLDARDRERDLLGRVALLESQIVKLSQERDEMAAELRVWRADAESQREAVIELERRNLALATTIAEQQKVIESQAQEIITLRQRKAQ